MQPLKDICFHKTQLEITVKQNIQWFRVSFLSLQNSKTPLLCQLIICIVWAKSVNKNQQKYVNTAD
jgi:hypothetical protein